MIDLYRRTSISPATLKIDLKDYILSDPYRSRECAIYMPNCGGIWSLQPETLFEQLWLDYCSNDVGVRVDLAQIFFRKPYYQHPGAHVDIDQNNHICGGGLNWTLDADDADMVWYKTPAEEPAFTQRSNTDRNLEWPLESLEECGRARIGQTPTLVRTDIPHTVEMRANERWLISVRFYGLNSWDQHLKAFKDWIIQ